MERGEPTRDLVLRADENIRYNTIIPEEVMNTTVTAVAEHSSATVTIIEVGGDGSVVSRIGSAKRGINLRNTGDIKTLQIIVTAQNEMTSRTYILTVERTGSAIDDLIDLRVTGHREAGLEPDFPIATNREYKVTGDIGAQIRLQMTARPGQTVTINDEDPPLIDGSSDMQVTASTPRDLEYGENPIKINVLAQDGITSQNYMLDAFRPVNLAGLDIQRLIPTFNPFERNYRVTIPNGIDRLTVAPSIPEDSGITYTIFEQAEGRDRPRRVRSSMQTSISEPIFFAQGQTKVITIELVANGTMNTYTVTAERLFRDNANLKTLRIVPNEGSPTSFTNLATDTSHEYQIPTRIVNDNINSVTLEAEVADSSATISDFTIDSDDLLATSVPRIDRNIRFNPGEEKVIRIEVTAQDEETTQGYTVTIKKQPSRDTRLKYTGSLAGWISAGI